jgi:hypothetical protein
MPGHYPGIFVFASCASRCVAVAGSIQPHQRSSILVFTSYTAKATDAKARASGHVSDPGLPVVATSPAYRPT